MQSQRCPNCQKRNDVSVFVHGQLARCAQCGIRFTVDRERPSDPRPSVPPRPDAARTDSPTQVPVSAVPLSEEERAALAFDSAPPPVAPNAPAAGHRPTAAETPNAKATPADDAGKGDARPNIPGYEIEALLGRGGMGEVWRARQLSLGRIVALKVLSPALAVERDFIRRFERESSALAALAHAHIVQVFDRGSANGHWYFTMEYVEGRSLRDKHADTPLSRTELLKLVAQVSRAVDYAHRKGVIHRDLKPENILVDHQGNAKVADFGLAGMSEVGRSSLTMTAVAMGTAHYMAPEQRKDAKNVDGRADLYSIGVMLYELLTGELPVGRFKTPREKLPDLDPKLDELILRLLDQEPSRRPRRAEEIAQLLETLTSPHRTDPMASAQVDPNGRVIAGLVRNVRENKSQKAMFVGAGVLLVLVLAVALGNRPKDPEDVDLPARIDKGKDGIVGVAFGAGAKDAIHASGGGWRASSDGLVREANAVSPRPSRAYLQPLRFDLSNAKLEADVTIDDTRGMTEPPSAEIVLYVESDQYVGLKLKIREDASSQLFYSTTKTGPKSVNAVQEPDPKPGVKHHVALFMTNNLLSANVDNTFVTPTALPVPGLAGAKAKLGLGCRVGKCRFSNVKLAGTLLDAAPAGAPAPAAQTNH